MSVYDVVIGALVQSTTSIMLKTIIYFSKKEFKILASEIPQDFNSQMGTSLSLPSFPIPEPLNTKLGN
jgi:hypothetical protein